MLWQTVYQKENTLKSLKNGHCAAFSLCRGVWYVFIKSVTIIHVSVCGWEREREHKKRGRLRKRYGKRVGKKRDGISVYRCLCVSVCAREGLHNIDSGKANLFMSSAFYLFWPTVCSFTTILSPKNCSLFTHIFRNYLTPLRLLNTWLPCHLRFISYFAPEGSRVVNIHCQMWQHSPWQEVLIIFLLTSNI